MKQMQTIDALRQVRELIKSLPVRERKRVWEIAEHLRRMVNNKGPEAKAALQLVFFEHAAASGADDVDKPTKAEVQAAQEAADKLAQPELNQ